MGVYRDAEQGGTQIAIGHTLLEGIEDETLETNQIRHTLAIYIVWKMITESYKRIGQ